MPIPLKSGSLVRLEDGTLGVHSHGTQLLITGPPGPPGPPGPSTAAPVIASDLRKPLQGGGAESFDLVLGPQTSDAVLGEEMSQCLFEKGFCVLRLCGGAHDAIKAMQDLAEDGQLGRLPEEVEEGYLGLGGKGRVLWLDPESKQNFHQQLLALDQMLDYSWTFFQHWDVFWTMFWRFVAMVCLFQAEYM